MGAQPLPYYNEYVQSSEYSDVSQTQLNTLVVLIYIASALFLVQMALALSNTYSFIIKQRRFSS